MKALKTLTKLLIKLIIMKRGIIISFKGFEQLHLHIIKVHVTIHLTGKYLQTLN